MQSLVHSLPEPMDLQDVKTKRPRHQNDIRAFSGASSFTEGTACGISEVRRRLHTKPVLQSPCQLIIDHADCRDLWLMCRTFPSAGFA